MKVIVKVPATTANLGPGFDAIGLALNLWNETQFSIVPESGIQCSILGEGSGKLPEDETNTIVAALIQIFSHARKPIPGLNIRCHNRIPMGSGLGSSSAALLTGYLGGNALLGSPFSTEELLKIAIKTEGHPDNVAPAMLGGLVASLVKEDCVIPVRLNSFNPSVPIHCTVVLPNFEFPTLEARRILPESISRGDAIFNISRAILVTEALRNGDLSLLGATMEDRIHQPYRLALIPGALDAMDAAIKNGAKAVALSGAGPSLIAFSSAESPSVGLSMQDAFLTAGMSSRIFELGISQQGAKVVVEDNES